MHWYVVGFPVNTTDGISQNGLKTLSRSLQSDPRFILIFPVAMDFAIL